MNFDLKHKDFLQGVVYIVGGIALLLYTFGIIEKGINLLLIVVAVLAIVYGLIKSGLYESIKHMISKR